MVLFHSINGKALELLSVFSVAPNIGNVPRLVIDPKGRIAVNVYTQTD